MSLFGKTGKSLAVCAMGVTLGAGLITSVPAYAQSKQIPLRDFFKNPQEAGHQIPLVGSAL
jgi:hypothetical protein